MSMFDSLVFQWIVLPLLIFLAPAGWLALSPWLSSPAWILPLLAVGLIPVIAIERRSLDVAGAGVAVVAGLAALALPFGPAVLVGGGGLLVAYLLTTPILRFVANLTS